MHPARTLALITLLAACRGDLLDEAPALQRRDPPRAAATVRDDAPREGPLGPTSPLAPEELRCGDLGAQRAAPVVDPAAPARARLVTRVRDEWTALPLHATRVDGVVVGTVFEATIVQKFVTGDRRLADATYTSPLSPGATVDRFEVRVGDRRLRGVARPHRARTASRPDRFAQVVPDLPPHTTVEVELHLVQPLHPRAGRYTLALPLAVDAPPVPAASVRRCGALDLRLDLTTGVPLHDLRSEHHTLLVSPQPGTVTLSLAPELRPDRDLALSWRLTADEPRARLLTQRTADGSGHLALEIHPPLHPATARPRELLLVVDAEWPPAREAAAAVLTDLDPRDTFQVLRLVDVRATALAPAPLQARPDHLARAREFLADIAVDGETAALAGISAALARPADPDRLRTLVVLGAGRLDQAALQTAVVRLRGDARLLVLVPGPDDPERSASITRLGRSAAVFASDLGSAAVAARVRELAGRPVLTDIQIDWGDLPLDETIPADAPDLLPGGLVIVRGRLRSSSRGLANFPVRISGDLGGGPLSLVVHADDHSADGRTGLAVEWTRQRIDDILYAGEPDPAAIIRVTDLGLRHAITTPYTALFAVEDRWARLPGGAPRRIELSADLPADVPQPWPRRD